MLAPDGDGFPMLERQVTLGGTTASTGDQFIDIHLAEIDPETTDVLGVEPLRGIDVRPVLMRRVASLNEFMPFLSNVEGLDCAPDDDPEDGLRTLLLNADNNLGAETPRQFIALTVPDEAPAPIPPPAGV